VIAPAAMEPAINPLMVTLVGVMAVGSVFRFCQLICN
jgi:hypothetical protein